MEEMWVVVRSPMQRHPELRLRAAPAWTVRRLKAELRRLIPGAPVSAGPLRDAARSRGRPLLSADPLGLEGTDRPGRLLRTAV